MDRGMLDYVVGEGGVVENEWGSSMKKTRLEKIRKGSK